MGVVTVGAGTNVPPSNYLDRFPHLTHRAICSRTTEKGREARRNGWKEARALREHGATSARSHTPVTRGHAGLIAPGQLRRSSRVRTDYLETVRARSSMSVKIMPFIFRLWRSGLAPSYLICGVQSTRPRPSSCTPPHHVQEGQSKVPQESQGRRRRRRGGQTKTFLAGSEAINAKAKKIHAMS